MTNTWAGQTQPFGVGQIFGNTVSIFFGRIGYLLPLALIPAFAIQLLTYGLLGPEQYAKQEVTAGFGTLAVLVLLDIVGRTLATAFVILAAYDARLGRRGRFGQYVSTVMGSLFTAIVCSLIVGICAMLGMVALVVPGLWIYGVWCVVIPAVVIERAGFRSLGRSAELTRDYRWPCIGTLVLINIFMGVIIGVITFVVIMIVGTTGVNAGISGVIAKSIAGGFGMGFSGVAVALIYARLREIKEGTRVEEIVDVFS